MYKRQQYGLDSAETTNLLYNGGLRIYTTVDPDLQAVMENALESGYLSLIHISLPGAVDVLAEPYTPAEFYAAVKGLEDIPEGGRRCYASVSYTHLTNG